MSIELDPPNQLNFQRPFTNGTTSVLKIRNPTDSTIAFKVKTTAPKQYCVRPNCGNVGPKQSVEVSVILQPMRTEPPAGFKCKDKFLVQSIKLNSTEIDISSTDLWPLVEKSRKEEIIEAKLRCHYLDLLGESASESEPIPTSTSNDGVPPLSAATSFVAAASSTSPSASTTLSPAVAAPPKPSPGNLTSAHVSSLSPPTEAPMVSSLSSPTASPAPALVGKVAPASPSPVATSNLAPSPDPDRAHLEAKIKTLEQKLAQTEDSLASRTAQVTKLQQELAQSQSELRKRSQSNSSVPSAAAAAAAPQVITRTIVNPSYYSPQLTLIIAIISFLVGVIMF